MKVLTCQQSKALEERAVQGGCNYEDLMETAGAAVAGFLRERYALEEKHVVVLCGKGNNGGDGFVVARRLCDLCLSMTILLVDGLPVTDLAKKKLGQIRETAVEVYSLADDRETVFARIRSADVLVDAIYGIGFHGAVREKMLPVFQSVNESPAPVVAVDIPSGLNGDSGDIPGEHIQADATVTFTTLKPVHIFRPAKCACGTVKLSQVGIGKKCIASQSYDTFVIDEEAIHGVLKPRDPESHKGTYGRLLCICGSAGMAGAAVLSSSAAVRSGAGIVDVALPRSIYPIVASNAIEPVYTVLEDDPQRATEQVLEQLSKATACLIGCGLGQGPQTDELVYRVIEEAKVPLVIDADGINAVARNIDVLRTASAPLILTPHPGEMARLLGITSRMVEESRVSLARQFAAQYGVTLVLKGHNTLIVHPDGLQDAGGEGLFHGKTAYNSTGNAGMAKGGSGDVLAGLIAGFCAQGIPPFASAYCGVYLHGKAGDRCAEQTSQRGMTPSQMVETLASLFSDYE
ncbi:MAG: NAD(P)H-hydrate dehydratase [Oscillospiraceae bacterium]|nr:NAD(P)H-hydrate dehydratase [Oscillospiraceae bacterium]